MTNPPDMRAQLEAAWDPLIVFEGEINTVATLASQGDPDAMVSAIKAMRALDEAADVLRAILALGQSADGGDPS